MQLLRILSIVLLLGGALHPFTFAQSDMGAAAGEMIDVEFEKHVGIDQLETTNITLGKIEDQPISYVTNNSTSPTMAQLISQLRGEDGEGLSSSFKLFLTKTQNRNSPYRTRNACERIANARLREGLGNAMTRGYLPQGVDIDPAEVQGVAGVNSSVAELIETFGIAEVEKMVAEELWGTNAGYIETVSIPHYDECNSTTKITRDPVNMRIIVVTSGNCQCKRYENKIESETAYLADYTVTLVAPVKARVSIETKKRFYGLLGTYQVFKAHYTVGQSTVSTVANCQCSEDTPPPPPLPPEEEEVTRIGKLIGWIGGLFGGSTEPGEPTPPEPETDTSDPAEEQADDSDDTTATDEPTDQLPAEDEQETEQTEPEDATDEPADEDEPEEPQDEEEEDATDRTCGTARDIDGRAGVATYPYRVGANGEVNFSCNGTCAPNQLCKVVPESVGAGRDSCVYCADICPSGTFVDQSVCESSARDGEICVSDGTCYRIEQEPEEPTEGGSCEEAVTLILNKYLGWATPPVTFSANGAVFANGPHKCFSSSELDQYHTNVIKGAIQTDEVQSLCPSLTHVSTNQDGAGNCTTTTVFSF